MAKQHCNSFLVTACTAFAFVVLLMRVGALSKRDNAYKHEEPRQLADALRTMADVAVGHCDLCADNWLFILGSYHTGSTTALSMLRSIPGTELRGEHGGVLELEQNQYKLLIEAEKKVKQQVTPWSSNHKADFHYLKCNAQHMMKKIILGKDMATMLGQTKVMGFKEIRHNSLQSLRFIMSLFPCARFVFTYRENWNVTIHDSSSPSRHETVRLGWRQWRHVVHMVNEWFGNTTALLPAENITASRYTEVLQRLLGLKDCRYTSVLHENNHEFRALMNSTQISPLEASCETSTLDFRLSEERILANEVAWDALEAVVTKACKANSTKCKWE